MKRGGGVHTLPFAAGRSWFNKVNGKVWSRHKRKKTAVAVGREIARQLKVEHTIHKADGSITEKNSYGNDPCPPRDGN